MGAAGASLARLVALDRETAPTTRVDRDLASAWFAFSLRPTGWQLPAAWDVVAGDYPTADGWIKLHTNAPHHRAAALSVLGVAAEREEVARAVASWDSDALESAVVAAGGAAAAMRSVPDWDADPQGRAVAGEPVVAVERTTRASQAPLPFGAGPRPLDGVRVLDLTRILAGPVATRLLAGWGATVLRIDPPDWDEPALAPEVTLGKLCARIDLRSAAGRERFLGLLASADVLVHGYRSDALDGLGLGADVRPTTVPGLVDVSLDAYGWTGPWATAPGIRQPGPDEHGHRRRRHARRPGPTVPVPLPVQALDQATGYLLAACRPDRTGPSRASRGRAPGGARRWPAWPASSSMPAMGDQLEGEGIDPARPRAGGSGRADRLGARATAPSAGRRWPAHPCVDGPGRSARRPNRSGPRGAGPVPV